MAWTAGCRSAARPIALVDGEAVEFVDQVTAARRRSGLRSFPGKSP